MSRIGNKHIQIPEGVTVSINGNTVDIKGKLGDDKVIIPAGIAVKNENGVLICTRANEEKHTKQLHGTTRALINNAIVGVSKGYVKKLEIVGIGFKANMKGKDIVLHLGYSHAITISPLEGVTLKCPSDTDIEISGNDKFKVGEVAALIRAQRKPEPYGGKGVKYKGEHILRKEGKRAAATKAK